MAKKKIHLTWHPLERLKTMPSGFIPAGQPVDGFYSCAIELGHPRWTARYVTFCSYQIVLKGLEEQKARTPKLVPLLLRSSPAELVPEEETALTA